MLKYIFFNVAIAAIVSCNSNDKTAPVNHENTPQSKFGKQLNISILWDLSDRISPKIHLNFPSTADRDVSIIKYFADYLKTDMTKKGAFMAKGKLKVFFSPHPADHSINSLASKLDIDLSNKDVKLKKEVFDNISNDFEQTARQIADLTIKTSKWEGSDIYRFFKNTITDYCISRDTSYRNILVILTDGYIYHPQSKGRLANKSEYILPDLLNSLGLRDNSDYKSIFQSKKCGLISAEKDLGNLEILVLEVNSEVNHKNDEDIIKLYLQNWFAEMKVKRSEVYNTDLPKNTEKRISDFLDFK